MCVIPASCRCLIIENYAHLTSSFTKLHHFFIDENLICAAGPSNVVSCAKRSPSDVESCAEPSPANVELYIADSSSLRVDEYIKCRKSSVIELWRYPLF